MQERLMDDHIATITRPDTKLFGESQVEINSLRTEAWQSFTKLGWPTRNWEQWKYTDLSRLLKHYQFKAIAKKPLKLPKFEACPHTYQAVMVDGEYCSELSHLPGKIEIMSLREAWKQHSQDVITQLQHISFYDHPMAILNQALMSDGIWIKVPANCSVDKPLHIVYMHSEYREPVATHYRNIIEMGAYSELTVIEDPQSQSRLHVLVNSVSQIYLGHDAKLDFIGIQRDFPLLSHIANQHIEQKHASLARLFNLALGGYLGRYDLQSFLLEAAAECEMNGIYMLTGSSHTDIHTRVDHLASHTNSSETYKGVFDQKSHGVFNGKVVVHPKIKGVDARQANHNLLLSNSAEIDTKPELEIYSDDVKCSHGATVGQLDEQALFYFQSRGIDLPQAKLMLTQAFVLELLASIKNTELKQYMQGLIETKMQTQFAAKDPL
ncbi:MAG: Fe-S cluster assembly protein SufD [Gammaproteobacteria bacterium]|nr:Fe-S cluster assembly protein SufD [Gammaproteobacteria bacterium]